MPNKPWTAEELANHVRFKVQYSNLLYIPAIIYTWFF
jgi:hypothetical protein